MTKKLKETYSNGVVNTVRLGLTSSFEEIIMHFFPCNTHPSILCGPKVFSSQIVEALKSIAHKFEMS